MGLGEFNKLDFEHRCDAIWEWGFYISRNKTNEFTKVLYSMNGFFAEMVIRAGDNKIIEVNAFEKVNQEEQTDYFIKNDNPFMRVS